MSWWRGFGLGLILFRQVNTETASLLNPLLVAHSNRPLVRMPTKL